MGLLLTLAGLIVGLYALSSALGLWMAHAIGRAQSAGEPVPDYMEDVPDHHANLLSDYAIGYRGHAWAVSVILLFVCLAAMAVGRGAAFWALGLALLIDSLLFLTYPGLRRFVVESSRMERLLDVAQSGALVAALGVLAWVAARAQG